MNDLFLKWPAQLLALNFYSKLLLIAGVLALTCAFRSFRNPLLQKAGALGVFATSYLVGFLLTGSRILGSILAASWLLLPWLDLLTRVRRFSLPVDWSLRHKSPPNSETFPALRELTDEVEGEGFEHLDDSGWENDEFEQFFRLFYKPDERLQAAICLVDQHDIAFYYVRVFCRGADGVLWNTWNYPFSYNFKLSPKWRVKTIRGDLSFLEILEQHRQFLARNGVSTGELAELDPDQAQDEIQKDVRAEITHNVAAGVLKRDASGAVRYSWRGLFFLWFQFLRDLVRLS